MKDLNYLPSYLCIIFESWILTKDKKDIKEKHFKWHSTLSSLYYEHVCEYAFKAVLKHFDVNTFVILTKHKGIFAQNK